MAIAMATGHLGPKIFSQVKANYICSNIGPMGTLAATSQLSVSGNQGVALFFFRARTVVFLAEQDKKLFCPVGNFSTINFTF